jgi:hypothetical protein
MTGKPVAALAAGELVRVRVRISSPVPRRWIALADPLPAGLEPLHPKLGARSAAPAGRGPQFSFTHLEFRDERVLAFADYLPGAPCTLEYLARATLPGRFTAPPATAEAMYDPAVSGNSDAARLDVRP